MRQITKEAVIAFENGYKWRKANTAVVLTDGEIQLFLHGNKIAKRVNKKLFISNGGWNSDTTKERLNGLHGVNIYQKNWEWFLNNQPWDGQWIEIN